MEKREDSQLKEKKGKGREGKVEQLERRGKTLKGKGREGKEKQSGAAREGKACDRSVCWRM